MSNIQNSYKSELKPAKFLERIKRQLIATKKRNLLVIYLIGEKFRSIDSVLIVLNRKTNSSRVYFDPSVWKPVEGRSSETHEEMPEIPFLRIDSEIDQAGLSRWCVKHLEPTKNSGVEWPKHVTERSAVWM